MSDKSDKIELRVIDFDMLDRALGNKKLVLFGAGEIAASAIVLYLEKYDIQYICDNDSRKWGSEFMGIEVCPPSKLLTENNQDVLVMVATKYRAEIVVWLLEHNILYTDTGILRTFVGLTRSGSSIIGDNEANIKRAASILADDMSKKTFESIVYKRVNGLSYYGDIRTGGEYFNDIFTVNESEIYVDCGVFDGCTIIDFIRFSNNRYAQIHAFEPDPQNYALAVNKFEFASNKIKLYNLALSNREGDIKFNATGLNYSSVDQVGTVTVRADKLDNILKDGASFIKMDIEGSEYDALLGAENTIKKYKPKLAISIYHKPQDIWEIPLLIHEMVPEYKFFVRHHTDMIYGSVLYCTM
jgi:FkbM family methyltransferase